MGVAAGEGVNERGGMKALTSDLGRGGVAGRVEREGKPLSIWQAGTDCRMDPRTAELKSQLKWKTKEPNWLGMAKLCRTITW